MKRIDFRLLSLLCLPLAFAPGCTDDGGDGTDEASDDTGTDTDTTTDTGTGTTGTDTTDTDTDTDTETNGTETDTTGTETDSDVGPMCGNAAIEEGEDCEGEDLAGLTCADVGFMDGDLACGGDCMFDTSACNEAVCGDSVAGGAEGCDGEDFGETTCESLGFMGGALACGDDCVIDESGCFNAECGDDEIAGLEECDGENLGEQTCAEIGFGGGDLSCNDDCSFNVELCDPCGNGVVDDGEVCDGEALADETCETQGFSGGDLACSDACDAFNVDQCTEGWWGDDFEGGELGDEWVGGNFPWIISQTMPHGGVNNAENTDIDNNEIALMEVDLDFVQDGSVSFWFRTSTENNFDFLEFFIDDVEIDGWAGINPWTEFSVDVGAGAHTLRWQYSKDVSVSTADDTVWVDDITTIGALLQ